MLADQTMSMITQPTPGRSNQAYFEISLDVLVIEQRYFREARIAHRKVRAILNHGGPPIIEYAPCERLPGWEARGRLSGASLITPLQSAVDDDEVKLALVVPATVFYPSPSQGDDVHGRNNSWDLVRYSALIRPAPGARRPDEPRNTNGIDRLP